MKTIHFVSHTHWDREWYQPFQQFRFRLVKLVDQLLDLLEEGSIYCYFTLDGQTIVLDDYLEIRPEAESRIRRLIQSGKLLAGPWYVLPDEFLEGPEAMIRNLLIGRRGCRRFTDQAQPMERIGYIPDSFGHISQLPQIAAGFEQDAVCFWRGVGDGPTELRWAAPDGTERLLLHLRESYSNGAWLPRDEAGFIRDLAKQVGRLEPNAATTQYLMMFGTDHMEPRPEMQERLRAAEAALGYRLVQSTLPQYLTAVRAELGAEGYRQLPLRQGEMRSPQRAHLLPAVLSARLWIKQQNARCETLLTRYAEPFAALAGPIAGKKGFNAFLRKSWEWLIQNHPHDSICGCSIDQVHDEMKTRFAWSEQIAEQVAQTSLEAIAGQIDTQPGPAVAPLPFDGPLPCVVVANPTGTTRSGRVRAMVEPAPKNGFSLVDETGRPAPYTVLGCNAREKWASRMDREALAGWLAAADPGTQRIAANWYFRDLAIRVDGAIAYVQVSVSGGPAGAAPAGAMDEALARLRAVVDDPAIHRFQVRLVEDSVLDIELLARDVPGFGYRAYWPAPESGAPPTLADTGLTIANEYYVVQADAADGTLTVTDRATGRVLPGLNRFVDGGDRGDEYTFTRPEHDRLVDRPVAPPVIRRLDDGLGPWLEIEQVYRLPRALAEGDRSRRSEETIDVPISSKVRLAPGVRRVEIETRVGNCAEDHRLRVHFPSQIAADRSWAEGHFDVVDRPIELPAGTDDWAEQPAGTHPQLGYVDVTDRGHGLMVINRGLPEYEALAAGPDGNGVTLALTLLRCVGWLSRPDLHNRQGHAGPPKPTPEAQCQGEHTFHYALVPHTGNYLTAHEEAAAFNAPLRAVATRAHAGSLPSTCQFLEVSPAAVVVSAIKPAEDGEGLIVRVYNAAAVPVEARVRLWRPFDEVALVRLSEGAPVRPLGTGTDAVTVPLHGKEIATLRFR